MLVTSGELCAKGKCTFDGLVVSKKWAKDNAAFMVALVKGAAKVDAEYRANVKAFTSDPAKVAAVAKLSGSKPEDVPATMGLYAFPTLQEQASNKWLGGGANGGAVKALVETSKFLKEQGRIQELAKDYSASVTPEWVTRAMQ